MDCRACIQPSIMQSHVASTASLLFHRELKMRSRRIFPLSSLTALGSFFSFRLLILAYNSCPKCQRWTASNSALRGQSRCSIGAYECRAPFFASTSIFLAALFPRRNSQAMYFSMASFSPRPRQHGTSSFHQIPLCGQQLSPRR